MNSVIFLDTLIFLHYKNINDIDWCKIVNNKDVTIIVCLATISELDEKKYEGKYIIQERAKKSLKFLESIIEKPEKGLRKDIKFKYLNEEPEDKYFDEFRLKTKSGDDRLICSILKYKKDLVDSDVLLATADTGFKLRAKGYDIKILNIPECYLDIDEDPKEKELIVLKKEILSLKNKIPKLKITFDNNKNHKKFLILKNISPKNYINEEIDALRKNYPLRTIESETSNGTFNFMSNRTPTKEELEKYNKELNEYYNDYEKYLKDLINYFSIKGLTIKLQIYLFNDGTTPADDILIKFFYPDGFELFKDNYFNQKPSRPNEPLKPWDISNILRSYRTIGESMNISNLISTAKIPHIQKNVSGYNIKKTKSYEANANVKRLMHTYKEKLEPLYLKFYDFETAKSFNINCKIIAENIPKEQEQTLHIKIEKEEKILEVDNFNIS